MRPLTSDQRAELEDATATFQAGLRFSEPGREYLQSRGLTGSTAQQFRLGVVPEGTPGWERFAGMVSIPNLCASGHVVGMKFRDITPEPAAKYTGRSGEAKRLFNTAALTRPSPYVAICEGEFDAMAVEQAGVPAVSVPSGAGSWKPHHSRLFAGYELVLVVADQDKAGQDLLRKLIDVLGTAVPARLPEGTKDINEVLIHGGDAAVRDALNLPMREAA